MLTSIIFYLIIGYINQFYSINMTAPYQKEPLYDVGFQYIPRIYYPQICDLILVLSALYFVFRWIFIDRQKIKHFIRMMAWIFVVRLCCFGSTTVPYPTEGCNARKIGDPMIWNVFPYMAEYHTHSCYDLMFSGHAAHVTLIWLFTIIYTKNKLEKVIVTITALLCNYLIIAARIHYTHDVIIGMTMSILMFGTFFSSRMCPFFYPKS